MKKYRLTVGYLSNENDDPIITLGTIFTKFGVKKITCRTDYKYDVRNQTVEKISALLNGQYPAGKFLAILSAIESFPLSFEIYANDLEIEIIHSEDTILVISSNYKKLFELLVDFRKQERDVAWAGKTGGVSIDELE